MFVTTPLKTLSWLLVTHKVNSTLTSSLICVFSVSLLSTFGLGLGLEHSVSTFAVSNPTPPPCGKTAADLSNPARGGFASSLALLFGRFLLHHSCFIPLVFAVDGELQDNRKISNSLTCICSDEHRILTQKVLSKYYFNKLIILKIS